jgi:hypothetical protein
MPDDLSIFEKMRWVYTYGLNKLRTPPTNEKINSIAESLKVDPGLEATAARGMCLIVFPGSDREDFCRNGMTNDACQNLAKASGGFARAVTPGSVCPQ